jgi:hypothetical protein
MTITVWLTLEECKELGRTDELILALGDNTSALGWMTRTGHLPPSSIYFEAANFIARQLASLVAHSGNFLAPQHLQGKKNMVTDWLSFKGGTRSAEMNRGAAKHPLTYDNPCNDQLTNRFLRSCPQLIPPAFKISQLPAEIFSFAQQSGQMLKSSMMCKLKGLPRLSTELQGDGTASVNETSPEWTHPFQEYPQLFPPCLSKPSLKYISMLTLNQQEIFLEDVKSQWQERQSEVPEGHWRRRSGVVLGGRPCAVIAETKKRGRPSPQT